MAGCETALTRDTDKIVRPSHERTRVESLLWTFPNAIHGDVELEALSAPNATSWMSIAMSKGDGIFCFRSSYPKIWRFVGTSIPPHSR